ncbi:MAG: nuclear transport factor 2 family protein [Nocardioidaceae bacterium]|nr:nuclear transport factor 2 family protein [Nocardioidaceae bacterium]
MDELERFLAEFVPQQEKAEKAIHDGILGPRLELWTRQDPVTVFGAAIPLLSGWDEVLPGFDWVASRFRRCTSYRFEVVAAGVSGDLAYVAGFEHTTAEVEGVERSYTLRTTHVYRREEGAWKIVHRHGDAPPADARGDEGAMLAQVSRE